MPNLTIFFSFKIPVVRAAWDYKFEIAFACPDKKSAFINRVIGTDDVRLPITGFPN